MKPYTAAADRARELYLLPTCPAPQRALEICCGREPLFSAAAWPGATYTSWMLATPEHARGQSLPFARGSFDLVILHKTLDDVAAAHPRTFDAQALLQSVAALLVPGGTLAGCAGNRTSPRHWMRTAGAGDSPAFLSLRGCRGLLGAAGFTGVRLFNLLPDWHSPLRLIEHEPAVTRIAFRREFEDAWRTRAAPRRWARGLALACGLVPHLESTVFFWGEAPC